MLFRLGSFRRTALPAVAAALLVAGAFCASLCGAQERSERFIAPGVKLLQWSTAAPDALYAVEVDMSQPMIRLGISYGNGQSLSLQRLSKQAEVSSTSQRYAVAGVNADFFFYPSAQNPGIPTNTLVVDGELIRTPFNRSCLVLGADGTPSIRILRATSQVTLPNGAKLALAGVNQQRGANQTVLYTPRYGPTTRTAADGTEVFLEPEQFPLKPGVALKAKVRAVQSGAGNGAINERGWVLSGAGPASALLKTLTPNDSVEIRVDIDPPLRAGDQVVGGGPQILRDSKFWAEKEGGSLQEDFARARHPRTAVGFNGKKLYLLVVDGRQPGYSQGMTLPELAEAMADLGCTDAMNLDGGGSSELWARGAVINHPSDGGERPVADSILVFSTAPKGDPVRIVTTPPEIRALAGAAVPVMVQGEDKYYNPVPVEFEKLQFESGVGEVRDGIFYAAAAPPLMPGQDAAKGTLRISDGAAQGETPVFVYPKPARVEVLPAAPRVPTKGQVQFHVRAFDSKGRPLAVPADLTWTAAPGLGTIDGAGNLTTAEAPSTGLVTVAVNGVTGSAKVEVSAAAARALEDFEGATDWKVRVSPAGLTGKAYVAEGPAHSGKHALHLDYDFGTASGTRALYALAEKPLGKPFALKAWVYGDGQGAWLRARVRDAKGTTHLLDLGRHVDWKDSWRELRAPISEDFPTPLRLESIYLVETDAGAKPKGSVLIDDLSTEQ